MSTSYTKICNEKVLIFQLQKFYNLGNCENEQIEKINFFFIKNKFNGTK
jgi:hypothetical protein